AVVAQLASVLALAGASNFVERSVTFASISASNCLVSRSASGAGPSGSFAKTVLSTSSITARCSTTSATLQRSGAGLYFHCASVSPLTESSTPLRVSARYRNALSRSAAVGSCAKAAAVIVIIVTSVRLIGRSPFGAGSGCLRSWVRRASFGKSTGGRRFLCAGFPRAFGAWTGDKLRSPVLLPEFRQHSTDRACRRFDI